MYISNNIHTVCKTSFFMVNINYIYQFLPVFFKGVFKGVCLCAWVQVCSNDLYLFNFTEHLQ